jgi:hypothetical protein
MLHNVCIVAGQDPTFLIWIMDLAVALELPLAFSDVSRDVVVMKLLLVVVNLLVAIMKLSNNILSLFVKLSSTIVKLL